MAHIISAFRCCNCRAQFAADDTGDCLECTVCGVRTIRRAFGGCKHRSWRTVALACHYCLADLEPTDVYLTDDLRLVTAS